jgi:transcriptional regulator with PAS, ATPase and Fis domain
MPDAPNGDFADLLAILERGEPGPEAWPDGLPGSAQAALAALARSFRDRIQKLEESEKRAQASLVSLRMMAEGYSRVKRELMRENEQLRTSSEIASKTIIGANAGLKQVMRLVEKVRGTSLSVLVTGETGTGKELIAQQIHAHGARARGPFVALNCAALPESLLESELFGIEKSVATGVAKRVGKIEEASGGTLFLDEVGDMPLSMQVHLLRAVQEQEVVPVGGRQPIKVDVRVISATNRDLMARIAAQQFREDLYYRLVGVQIHVPPLRERPEDVGLLVDHFFAEAVHQFGSPVRGVSPQARAALLRYAWPGNVRELIGEIRRAVVLAEGDLVTPIDLSPRLVEEGRPKEAPAPVPAGDGLLPLREARRGFERDYLRGALARAKGSRQRAAAMLGISSEGLRQKLRALGLAAPDVGASEPA